MSTTKTKVLFLAEGATLAHVARSYVLARSLPAQRFEVAFARPGDFAWLTADAPFPVLELRCQDARVFARRLALGAPLYDINTLRGYVEDDLALIDAERPDIVIGDFRLSLSVSARLRSTPYATICDAYWSPERPLAAPLPVLWFTRLTPIPLAAWIFGRVSGFALRMHARPMERLRAQYGLPSLGHDLRRCYTDADMRLFANFPALFPDVATKQRAAFLGPVSWSPISADGLPELTTRADPLIYVTMGSSGKLDVLEKLLPALATTGHRTLIASAGRSLTRLPQAPNVQIFDFLPGDELCRHAALVICNGGSPSTNQALSHGVPVLGIAQNMDQFLNMQAVTEFGAGLMLRADRADTPRLRQAIDTLMGEPKFAQRARALADSAKTMLTADQQGAHLADLLDALKATDATPHHPGSR